MTLSIVLATRGRPHLLVPTIRQTIKNMKRKDTRLIVVADDDDEDTIFVKPEIEHIDDRITMVIEPRAPSLGAKYNRVMKLAPADVYLVMVDYAPHVTEGFDEKILQAAAIHADGYAVVYNWYANQGFSQINAVTHKLAAKMGGIYPVLYPFWFVDHHLDDIAQFIGRIVFAEISIDTTVRDASIAAGRDWTQARRETWLWALLFDACSEERQAFARSLIKSADFKESKERKKALLNNIPRLVHRSMMINEGARKDFGTDFTTDAWYDAVRAAGLERLKQVLTDEEWQHFEFLQARVAAELVRANVKPSAPAETNDHPMMPIRRRVPSPTGEPDYSLAFYPDPPSHDFLTWLSIAELKRRHHGAPGPLKVKFGLIDGQLGTVDWGPLSPWEGQAYQCGLSKAYSDQMMENVLRPAIEMMGAVEEPSISGELALPPFQVRDIQHYVEYDYHIGHLVDAGRAGYEVPKFSPPQWAHDEVKKFLGKRKPVIITLREIEAQPERNSNLDAWLKFAESIQGDHEVLFLRDTRKADEPFSHFPIWPRASRNAYVRAALYQSALVNMFVGNGPCEWCVFSDAPYLIFKQLVPALPNWEHGGPAGWKKQAHMEVGDQYPWASQLQRLTWTDDTFDSICSEFDAFLQRLPKAKAA